MSYLNAIKNVYLVAFEPRPRRDTQHRPKIYILDFGMPSHRLPCLPPFIPYFSHLSSHFTCHQGKHVCNLNKPKPWRSLWELLLLLSVTGKRKGKVTFNLRYFLIYDVA